LYLAHLGIIGGDDWKEELIKNLKDKDAVISLLSTEAILKPWIYVEWSHYWVNNKKFYVLKTGNLSNDDIFAPMLTRQITNLDDKTSVRGLVEAIARDSGTETIPYDCVDALLEAVREGNEVKTEQSFGEYRRNTANLPASDAEKLRIARYFFAKSEWDTYERIIMTMRDDAIKLDEISEIIRSGGKSHEREISIVENISNTINSAEKLANVAIELVKDGAVDAPLIRRLIDTLAQRNQAEMRRLGVYLVQQQQIDSQALTYLAAKMTNMAELRKIAEAIMDAGKTDTSTFIDLIGLFHNDRELLKVGERLISLNLHTPESVDAIRDQLTKRGGTYLNNFNGLL
jgi:polyhydroxyalkanoate synthesis regulator phasin